MKFTVTYRLNKREGVAEYEKEYRHMTGALAAFMKLLEQMRSAIAQRKNYFSFVQITIRPEDSE